ncbi:MAG: hypothetical protein L0Y72_22470 [Gemmataceae bacterium]|nr:hypothetical protein [Gemmataceae bacterium]
MTVLDPTVSAEFLAHHRQSPGSGSADAELRRWQELCRVVIEERERLRQALAETSKQRDLYLRSLYAASFDVPEFTKEEILGNLGKNQPLTDLVAESKAER